MYHLIIRNSLALVTLLLLSCNFSNKKSSKTPSDEKHFPPKADSVLNIINLVNDHWQNSHPEPDRAFWHPAAYHTGNIEAYKVTGNERFLQYSKKWAEHNNWKGATSDDRSNWKYHYGETPEHVLFGDWQIFQGPSI